MQHLWTPRMCCKERTCAILKSLRCNTYKKQRGRGERYGQLDSLWSAAACCRFSGIETGSAHRLDKLPNSSFRSRRRVFPLLRCNPGSLESIIYEMQIL